MRLFPLLLAFTSLTAFNAAARSLHDQGLYDYPNLHTQSAPLLPREPKTEGTERTPSGLRNTPSPISPHTPRPSSPSTPRALGIPPDLLPASPFSLYEPPPGVSLQRAGSLPRANSFPAPFPHRSLRTVPSPRSPLLHLGSVLEGPSLVVGQQHHTHPGLATRPTFHRNRRPEPYGPSSPGSPTVATGGGAPGHIPPHNPYQQQLPEHLRTETDTEQQPSPMLATNPWATGHAQSRLPSPMEHLMCGGNYFEWSNPSILQITANRCEDIMGCHRGMVVQIRGEPGLIHVQGREGPEEDVGIFCREKCTCSSPGHPR